MLTVSGSELAAMLGVNPRTVRDLAARGILVRAGRGTYDVAASVRGYCGHLREAASGRGGEASVIALTSERSRLAREQADAFATKNALARNELVRAVDVERAWTGILHDVRRTVLAVPSRLTDVDRAIVQRVDQEIRDALEGLANAG